MKDGALLLDLPAARAVRWVALRRLEEALAARERLGAPEGLHDFRVAVRRLRCTLEAYRGDLPGLARKRDLRRLREIARATGTARDAEVRLAWLGGRRVRARGAERVGVAWSRESAERSATEASDRVEQATDRFPRLAERLRRRLERYRARVAADEPGESPAFRVLLAAQLASAAEDLERALGEVADESRQEEAHRARIAAKRLRYLLDPVAAALTGGREALRDVRRLQDALGAMHDVEHHRAAAVAEAGSEPGPGETALIARLGRERRMLFAAVRRDWLGGGAAPLLGRVRALAAGLAGPPQNREIERKYLLRAMPSLRGKGARRAVIEQGYLPGDRLVERVRRERGPDGVRHYRTVKLGAGISRIEVEEACDPAVFRALWRLTAGRRVRKVRYRVAEGERVWEIDRFRDRPLVLAEVELPDESAQVSVPSWLAAVLEREVTGEAAYLNLNLAG